MFISLNVGLNIDSNLFTETESQQTARFRSLNTTYVDDENEIFVRSNHPLLSSLQHVWVSESVFGDPVWVVNSPVKGVEAAGRHIHFLPQDYDQYIPNGILTPRYPDIFNRHFQTDINPRRFLTSHHLDSLRELFPLAVGVEVLVAGFMIILFDRVSDVKEAYRRIWPLELAGLRVFFEVIRYDCTTTTSISSGIGLSSDQSDGHHLRAGCLGLGLRLPDGSNALTTITHGFVKCPEASKSSQIVNQCRGLYDRVKTALTRYLPPRVGGDQTSHIIAKEQLTNSPLGKKVWLASSNTMVG